MEIAVDGRRVYAATGGKEFDPALPTVAFVHGAGMDHSVWALQTRWFAHHGRNVLALDLPGHGRTAGAALSSIEESAGFVLSVLSAVGAKTIGLVGHSMGALIALEAAARAGGCVTGLALLGMTPDMPVHPDLMSAAERGEHLALDLMTNWALGLETRLGGNEAPGLWRTGAALRLLERADPRSLAADLVACNAYKGAEAAAAIVASPVLLLLGADDRMTPAARGRVFAVTFTQCRTAILPHSGHMLMIEDPRATLAALKEVV